LLAEAKGAAEDDKHYDALPAFWQYVLVAYESGVWNTYWNAEKNLSIEFCEIGWLDRAAYHAMIALDSSQARKVASQLLTWQRADVIRLSLQKLLPHVGLRLHVKVAADFVASLGDAVPVDMVENVLGFLLSNVSKDFVLTERFAVSRSIWKTLGTIGVLYSQEQADRVVKRTLSLNICESDARIRLEIIRCLWQVLPRASENVISEAAVKLLPLATTHRQDIDFTEVINVLCGIATTVGGELRKMIGNALFPGGEPVTSVVQIEVMPVFDMGISEQAILDQLVRRACNSVRNQVQIFVSEDDRSHETPAGSFGYFTVQDHKGQQVRVHFGGDAELNAILAHRRNLSPAHVTDILSCLLEMIIFPENIIANKIYLCRAVDKLAPQIPEAMLADIWNHLSKIAGGNFEVCKLDKMSSSGTLNRLNPLRMDIGTVSELRGVALHTLGQVEKHHPGVYGIEMLHLTEEIYQINDPSAKALALATIRELPALSENLFLILVWALRDPSPKVATTALWAVGHKADILLDPFKRALVMDALKQASASPHSEIRKAAASAAKNLLGMVTSQDPKFNVLGELLQDFRNDIAFSVRAQVADVEIPTTNTEISSE